MIWTFSDFQLVYAITRGGPVNSTHLLATLAFQRGIPGGMLGEGGVGAGGFCAGGERALMDLPCHLVESAWDCGEGGAGDGAVAELVAFG